MVIGEYCFTSFVKYVQSIFVQLSCDSLPFFIWAGMGSLENNGAESLSDTPVLHMQATLEITTQCHHPTERHFTQSPDIVILQKQLIWQCNENLKAGSQSELCHLL